MRRRRVNGSGIPRELELAALPTFEDDYTEKVTVRLERYREWEAIYDEWLRKREVWSMTQGWPGGDDERIREETSYAYPGEPFDPDSI